jgi:hypothetical protein
VHDGRLVPQELAAAQAFQTWFVETYFGGDYRVIKDSDGEKLTKLLDVFDSYDLDMDGFLDTAEVAALATDLGLDATFLDAYINCLFEDSLIDEDELLKTVCVGGNYSQHRYLCVVCLSAQRYIHHSTVCDLSTVCCISPFQIFFSTFEQINLHRQQNLTLPHGKALALTTTALVIWC